MEKYWVAQTVKYILLWNYIFMHSIIYSLTGGKIQVTRVKATQQFAWKNI